MPDFNRTESRISLRIAEENTKQSHDAHTERVIQIAYDAQRRERSQFSSHQHLGAIGDDALHQARECIKQTGTFTRVKMKLLGNVLSYRTDGNNGNGIVGRTAVGNADQRGNRQFSTSLAIDMTGQLLYNVCDAYVV